MLAEFAVFQPQLTRAATFSRGVGLIPYRFKSVCAIFGAAYGDFIFPLLLSALITVECLTLVFVLLAGICFEFRKLLACVCWLTYVLKVRE